MRTIRAFVVTLAGAGMVAPVAQAGQSKPWKEWYGHVSGGIALTMDQTGDIVEDGWNLSGGATYWPDPWPVGLVMELGYNSFDIEPSALEGIADSGDVEIWTVTVGAVWATNTSPVDFYVTANAGWNRRRIDLKEPGLAFVPPVCDPFWYWCSPGGIVSTDVIVETQTTDKFGWDAGVGVSFTLANDSQVFLEARYHWLNSTREDTEWLPISVGYRW